VKVGLKESKLDFEYTSAPPPPPVTGTEDGEGSAEREPEAVE